ncbi:hypothetical protein [Natronocalculus amylovorans]|uniref:Uncharacterized protein n=1 Tax=Natronocalculus amylovorans TaxID=2917812 RepID=A0AAE3KAH9_9EURY|nr:hypothetical protein [Natronocalculus amylovorans]MCL9818335.1 hypothetical protein [Natronocalculus amylovorans]
MTNSGRFPRIRQLYDVATNPNRYRNEDETDLDEYVSPNEWRDTAKPGWGDRIKSRRHTILSFGFIGFLVVLIIGVHSQRYLPELYGNPILSEAIKWLIAIPTTWVLATKWQRGRIARLDQLHLKIGEGVKSYYGVLESDSDGNYLFVPLKGFDWFGLRGRRLTLGDLSDDMAEDFAKQGRQPDDPAKIRLEDSMYAVKETALGDVAVSLTSGLQIDGYGRESDLYTSPPDIADEESYKQLAVTLEKVVDEVQHLRDEVQARTRQRNKWKAEAEKERQEIRDEVMNIIEKTGEAGVYRSGRNSRPRTISMNGESE